LVANEIFQNHPTSSSSLLVPTGTIITFAGSSAPGGWLLCNGGAVSRTTYSVLFAVIGITYGNGDGVNTFNLPDFRGRTALGAGQGTGLTNRTLAGTGGPWFSKAKPTRNSNFVRIRSRNY
jgi:microcystin-dependent protein